MHERRGAFGDIAIGDDGKPSLHFHAVRGFEDAQPRAGFIMESCIRREIVMR
jgi:predicted DNA-binding protein with PD1-like motif